MMDLPKSFEGSDNMIPLNLNYPVEKVSVDQNNSYKSKIQRKMKVNQMRKDSNHKKIKESEAKQNKRPLSLITYLTLGRNYNPEENSNQLKKMKNPQPDLENNFQNICKMETLSDTEAEDLQTSNELYETEEKVVFEKPVEKKVDKPKEKSNRRLIVRNFDKEELLKPLLKGWKREVVMRVITEAERKDVYYYSPCGSKLRSKRDVEKCLIEKGYPFTLEQFSFAQVIMGFEEPYEVCRTAAARIMPEAKEKKCPQKSSLVKTERSKKGRIREKRDYKALLCSTTKPPAKEQSNFKVEESSLSVKCKSPGNMKSSYASQSHDALQKKVLYVEELNEGEKSPLFFMNESSDAMESSLQESVSHLSQGHGGDNVLSPPTPYTTYLHSIHNAPSPTFSKGNDFINHASRAVEVSTNPQRPQIPVFQLHLDDIYQNDDNEEVTTSHDLRTQKEGGSENLNFGEFKTPAIQSSKIRVRPIAELCSTGNEDSVPINYMDGQNLYTNPRQDFLNDSPSNWNLRKNDNCHYPSFPNLFTVNNRYRAPSVSAPVGISKHSSDKLCDILVRGQVPVLYPSSSTQNISINLQFNVPKVSPCNNYVQLDNERLQSQPFLTNSSQGVCQSNGNNLSNLNNVRCNSYSADTPAVLKNLSMIKFNPVFNRFPSDYLPDNTSRLKYSCKKPMPLPNQNLAPAVIFSQSHDTGTRRLAPLPTPSPSTSVSNSVALPFSSTLESSLRSLASRKTNTFFTDLDRLSSLSQTPMPSVERVKTISEEDWLSMQD